MKVKHIGLRLASYSLDPLCKVREHFYSLYLIGDKPAFQKATQIAICVFWMTANAAIAPLTAPIGLAIKALVKCAQHHPYLYFQQPGNAKELPQDKKLTLVSHNVCYMPGGYSITDGQVKPATDRKRIDDNLKKIHELDPDVVCLYEVPDICDADYISSKLANYPFIIPVAGIKIIGPSSMMYVASKYEIARESIEFESFIKDQEITGRARFSEKGVLTFDLVSKGKKRAIASIVSTHLQHSEVPAHPREEDINSRLLQMEKVAKKIHEKIALNRAVILTGDLNQEEEELKAFMLKHPGLLKRDPFVVSKATWGGDGWCAKLQNKPSSNSLVLDYTFIAGKADSIRTQIVDVGYQGDKFLESASSDHSLLYSEIALLAQ